MGGKHRLNIHYTFEAVSARVSVQWIIVKKRFPEMLKLSRIIKKNESKNRLEMIGVVTAFIIIVS